MVVAVRDEDLVEAATDFARVCARVVVLPALDVVVPPGPVFLVSGACVVLLDRDNSVVSPSVSLMAFLSCWFDVRGRFEGCLAIVPGFIRPERELAKAGLASFKPPGTRARVGAFECTCVL